MNSYKIFCKKVESKNIKNKDLFYLYLYYHPTKQKHPTLSALGIKVPKSSIVFEKLGKSYSTNSVAKISSNLPKEYLLKSGFESVDKLNKFLSEKLEEFVKVNGRKEFVERDKRTLNEWFEILMSGIDNQGTLNRYINVKNLLELFQSQRKGGSYVIYMSEIDVAFINQFKAWLMTQPKSDDEPRKQNSSNSAIYKLKCLKAVINKSHFSKYYSFIVNPFDHISFSEVKRPHKVLTIDELQKLIKTELVEVYRRKVPTKDGVMLWGKPIEGGVDLRNQKNKRYTCKHTLNDIRNYFLFQFFSQGLRVSDLITLRWSNFVRIEEGHLKIEKIMVKTQELVKVLVNQNLTTIIRDYITRYDDFLEEEINELKVVEEEIENKRTVVNRDVNYFVLSEYLWWEYVPEQYKTILQRNPHTRKVNNTMVKGFHINSSCLDEVRELMGEVDEFDYVESKRLSEINEELKNLKYSISKDPSLKNEEEKLRLRYERFIKKYFFKLLSQEYEKERSRTMQYRNSNFEVVQLKKHHLINEMIMKLANSRIYKEEFVFELLQNKDFKDIEKSYFSKMTKEQYKKFQSVRTYYNGLLKIVSEQCGLGDKLTSHVSRHSFTSITMELIENVSPFDLMNSLGHKHVSTTQTYMKSFGDKSVEKINSKVQKSIGLSR
jgi:integrase